MAAPSFLSLYAHFLTLLRSYALTLLRSYALTLLRSYALTLLRSYALPFSRLTSHVSRLTSHVIISLTDAINNTVARIHFNFIFSKYPAPK